MVSWNATEHDSVLHTRMNRWRMHKKSKNTRICGKYIYIIYISNLYQYVFDRKYVYVTACNCHTGFLKLITKRKCTATCKGSGNWTLHVRARTVILWYSNSVTILISLYYTVEIRARIFLSTPCLLWKAIFLLRLVKTRLYVAAGVESPFLLKSRSVM